MFEIEDLFEYDLLEEGAFDSLQEFIDFTNGADPETIFALLKEGAFDSIEDFKDGVNFAPKKKIETGDSTIISPTENTESNTSTPTTETAGSSDSSDIIVENPNETVVQENVETPKVVIPGIEDPNSTAAERISAMMQDGTDIFEFDEQGNVVEEELEEGETWLEESWLGQALDWAFDDVPIFGVLSADFWGDMYRAIGNGYTKGQSVDDSIALFAKGKNISDEDLADYIAAIKKSENVAVSDEMKSFQNIYESNGGGVLGFILGFGANLSIAPELLIDSLASMLNPASAAAAGAGAAVGAGTGAALTAISGPGALFGAGAGGVAGAMGGASSALEFGMSYTEFMKEEVEKKGGEFDQEGIRQVLNDPEALQSIRNRAATRGLAIGMIDAMTAGIAGKAIGVTGKALAKGTAKTLAAGGKGTVTRAMVNKGIEISAGLGVEIAGGSLGEATARALAGQKMDVAEIGLEGFAGAGNAPISLARGVYTTPRYRLNGDLVTKNYILATIGTATPQQIADMNIEIKNDKDIQAVITDLKATSQFALDLDAQGIPPGANKDAIIKLEIEKSKLPDSRSEATRLRRAEIDQKIAALIDGADSLTKEKKIIRDGNTFTEILSVSKSEAIAQLESDGVENPSDIAISDMQNAMMQQLENSDLQAEKAIAAEEKLIAEFEASIESEITKQEVLDRIDKDVYTDQEFDNTKKLIIKEKLDAFQKSSTESVDVQEQTQDGEGVGEVDTNEEVTEETNTTELTSEQEEEVNKEEKKERYRDSQIPISQQKFTIEDDSGDTIIVTVTTTLDGSRKITQKLEDGTVVGANSKTVSKDNTLTNEEYVNAAFGEVKKTEDVDIKNVRNPKFDERMSDRQRKAAGLDVAPNSKNFTTKRQKQPGRYRVPGSRSVDIEIDAEGNIRTVNRKTGRPLKEKPTPAVQEYILENIIDVNDGTPLQLDESTNLTPEQYTAEIAENSNNIKEVAETIDLERKRSKDLSKSEREENADPLGIAKLKGKITEQQFIDASDVSNVTPNMKRFWFAKKQKNMFGKETGQDMDTLGLDTLVMELDGYTQENESEYIQKVVDFIIENETGKVKVQTGKSLGLVDLEIKFENLTGLKPTKRNINKVLSIDPNREPLVATKQRNNQSDQKAASEPGKFGKKRGPSPKKITGQSQPKIKVDEASALKSQIKLEAKAAKQSETAYRKAANKVAAYITDIKAKGKISTRQAKLLLAKTLRSKLTDAKQVEKLNTYLTKVMGDATIAERLFNAKKKQSQIDKNIKKGLIGSENIALVEVLQELGKTDLSSIPLNKLDAFESLMNTYGVKPKRGALNIKTIGADTQIGLDILNSLEQTEKVDVAPKKKKKAKEYDLVEAITEIQTTKPKLEAITDKESKAVADLIQDFTKEDIESLIIEKEDGTFDYSQLEKLRGVKQNLAQGIVTPTAMNLLIEVFSNRAAKKVSVPISKVTLKGIMLNLRNITSSIKTAITSNTPSGKNILLDKIRSGPAAYIDNAFGNLNSKTIYKNTFGKLAQVYERFTVDTKKDFAKIEAAERFLEYDGKGLIRRTARVGNSANKIVAKKYKIRLLQLAREHILNIDKNGKDNPVAPSAKKMIDATLKFFKDREGYENDFKILNKIAEEFTVDGEISLDKLEKSLTPGEKKALKIYDDVNASLASKAKFTSAVLRSNRIDLLNGWSHRIVLSNSKDSEVDVKAKADIFANASTKGGTMVERQKGVRPVSFDPSLSAQRGVQETNLDYYMTPTVREVQKTANKVLENMESEGTVPSIKAAKALQKSLTEILKITFTETMRDVTLAEEFANKVKRTAYQAILASVTRMGAEIVSNMNYIAANPEAAARGFTKYATLSFLGRKKGADILNALGSTETTKLFDPKSISSRMTDMSNFAQTSSKSQRARSTFMNFIGQLLKLGPKQTVGAIDTLASGMIQAPDKALSIPMWYGTFSQTFKNETGIDLSKKDMEAIGEGTSKIQNEDGSIKKEYKKAVERSTRKADQMGTMISSSNNPFKGVIKNQSRTFGKSSGGLSNMYRTVNKFMASFSLFEYGTVRNAIGALYKSGDMSRTQASAVLLAATARMTMYPILYGVFSQDFDELFSNAEVEEDESDIEDIIMRQTVGTMLQLMTRRSIGNVPNLLPSYGIEKFNELMMGDFREGDYNPFKHSISFSQFNEDDIAKKGFSATMLKIFAGPMGPILNTVERSVALLYRSQNNKTKESRDKNMDELTSRMTLEALGNIGLIPFYKDVRRVVMKEMFEDGVIQRREVKARKERKKYMDFLKVDDPEEYRYELKQDKAKQEELDNEFQGDDEDSFVDDE